MPNSEKKKYEYRDSSGVEHSIEISKENFALTQQDKSIHDQKFKTKPTTFFKDALKRFSKNKSSVAGAVILGLLLILSVLIPVVDTSDLTVQRPEERLLAPKLFNAGTGWWDGTKRVTGVACDTSTKFEKDGKTYYYPDLSIYPERSISNLSEPKIGLVNSAAKSVNGGFLSLVNDKPFNGDKLEQQVALKSSLVGIPSNSYRIDKTYDFEMTFLDDKVGDYLNADFSVYFTYDKPGTQIEPDTQEKPSSQVKESSNNEQVEEENNENNGPELEAKDENVFILKDYKDTSKITKSTLENKVEKDKPYNVSILKIENIFENFKKETGFSLDKVSNLTLKVSLIPSSSTNSSALFINKMTITSKDDALFDGRDYGFKDANDMLLNQIQNWTYLGNKSLYHGVTYVCDFTFDTYEKVYGIQERSISQSKIEQYIENGWISNTFNVKDAYMSKDPNAYYQQHKTSLTDSRSPIIYINKVRDASAAGIENYEFECTIYGYRYHGYTSMPRFIVGTDDKGLNLLKQVFVGLRNSLGLGIIIFAICFTFGLIIGSICGYFGGAVDMVLQRFIDILAGVPWIVIMTLAILFFKSNFGTFIMAMCLTGWIGTSSLTRTQFYRFRDREYTLASRTLGAGNTRLIFRHILPNAMGTIITSSVLMIPSVIFTEATISYLGLGFKDMVSLGVTLSDNQAFLSTYPHLILFPSAIMALIMISFNLFGNGLRDAFNPSLKGGE